MKLSTIKYLQSHKNASSEIIQENTDYPTKVSAFSDYKKHGGNDWIFPNMYNQKNAYCETKPHRLIVADIPVEPAQRERVTRETRYMSKCSKWGDYNPHQYAVSRTMRVYRGLPYMVEKSIELHHGTTSKLSECYITEYHEKNGIVTSKLFYKAFGKELFVCNGARRGHTAYHAPTIKLAIKGLNEKIIKQRELAKVYRQASRNESLTAAKLEKMFGWCKIGMGDWKENVLPARVQDKKRFNPAELLAILKSPEADMGYAHSAYPAETAQLIKYLRSV